MYLSAHLPPTKSPITKALALRYANIGISALTDCGKPNDGGVSSLKCQGQCPLTFCRKPSSGGVSSLTANDSNFRPTYNLLSPNSCGISSLIYQ